MKIIVGFEKNCPVCWEKFTGLLEYAIHILILIIMSNRRLYSIYNQNVYKPNY